MSSYFTHAPGPYSFPLFVRPDGSGLYTAGVLGLNEVRATAATQHEALQTVKRALLEWLATTYWVQMQVPPQPTVPPVGEFAGHAKDDPEHEEYLDHIRRYREEMDEQFRQGEGKEECSDISSTPTT